MLGECWNNFAMKVLKIKKNDLPANAIYASQRTNKLACFRMEGADKKWNTYKKQFGSIVEGKPMEHSFHAKKTQIILQ